MATIKAYVRTAFNYALAFVLGAILTLMLVESMNLVQTGDRVHRFGPEQTIEVPHPGADEHIYTINGEVICNEAYSFDGDQLRLVYTWMNDSYIILIDCQSSAGANPVARLATPTLP